MFLIACSCRAAVAIQVRGCAHGPFCGRCASSVRKQAGRLPRFRQQGSGCRSSGSLGHGVREPNPQLQAANPPSSPCDSGSKPSRAPKGPLSPMAYGPAWCRLPRRCWAFASAALWFQSSVAGLAFHGSGVQGSMGYRGLMGPGFLGLGFRVQA